jgi:hypothetical protein
MEKRLNIAGWTIMAIFAACPELAEARWRSTGFPSYDEKTRRIDSEKWRGTRFLRYRFLTGFSVILSADHDA